MQNAAAPFPRLAPTPLAALAFLLLLLGHTPAHASPVVGLTTGNRLVMFDSAEPGRIFHNVAVTGLAEPGEILLAIDYGPSKGRVYGVSDRSRLYLVNVETGAVAAVGTGPFSPPLQGVSPRNNFGLAFDIDPEQNVARVINCSFNYRIGLDTGTVFAVDTPPRFAPGEPEAGQPACFTGAAHTNNFRGATSTTLYTINSSLDLLMRVGSAGGSPVSPNSGQTFTVGRMFGPIPPTELSGFDIAPGTASLAFVALTGGDASATRLGVADLTTGRAHIVGHIGGQQGSPLVFLRGLAALPADGELYAVTATNKLLRFNAAAPGVLVSSKQLTGLQPNDQIVGLDFGHAVGPFFGVGEAQLYALGSSGQVYVIDPETAAPVRFESPRMPPLEGTSFGFEFVGGFFRITSDAGQNMTVSAFTPPSVHPPPAYAADDRNAGKTPRIIGLGFRRSILPSVTAGTLYGIDSAQNTLVTFNPEPATLRTVGSLSLFLTGNVVGFDIQTGEQVGYAASSPLCFEGCTTPSTLVSVDLQFGQATRLGGIGGGEQVRALAVVPKHSFTFTRALVERVSEGSFALTLAVARTDDASTAAVVNYATSEETDAPGAASPRSDFNAAFGTLRFAPGENVKTIQILINEDSHVERHPGPPGTTGFGESFSVALGDPSPGYFVGPAAVTTVFIEDDNPEAATNPVDSAESFVRQHYHDFFNREGDLPGVVFWTLNIETCGANAGCRSFRRIETSAAFFLSIEFQETGFFVYRFHEAAFDTGPRLALSDFLRDALRVGEGVVVGQGDWQARLEANKQAYAEEFVTRSSFVNRFGGMSNALYVDTLNANAGGALSQAERDQLVARLNSNAVTRAQALRAVAEDEDLKRNEKNRAFVLMQYFGYLRREPDEAGYNFWLTKLNNHGGDFRSAEMVKAFITSGEYRARFGPR